MSEFTLQCINACSVSLFSEVATIEVIHLIVNTERNTIKIKANDILGQEIRMEHFDNEDVESIKYTEDLFSDYVFSCLSDANITMFFSEASICRKGIIHQPNTKKLFTGPFL